jgi:hypothetical protein
MPVEPDRPQPLPGETFKARIRAWWAAQRRDRSPGALSNAYRDDLNERLDAIDGKLDLLDEKLETLIRQTTGRDGP